MNKLKLFITQKYLPAYSKDVMTSLIKENEKLKQELKIKDAYINGLHYAIRSKVKIINNGGKNE